MNRKVVLLNLALLALLALLGWQLRQHWAEAQAAEDAKLREKPQPPAVTLPAARSAPEVPVPADYIDVAQRTLFSKDRDPNVIIEPPPPPPPPPPEKPVPPLPSYHGQMILGDPSILLSLEGTGQKAYRAGEQIGDFKVVSFDRERIAFEWEGKTIERSLAELKRAEPTVARNTAPKQQAAAPPPRDTRTKIGSGSQGKDPRGNFVAGKYMCKGDDKSANGTVFEGFRKIEVVTMMGPTCAWEPIE